MRIAKAVREGKRGRVKSLQRILTRSFYAKSMAVKRVTSNKGKNTPGVDGVVWRSARAKAQAVKNLRQHGYKAQPLSRTYIPKKSGKLRPLSIPVMHDRAMQALHALSLAPVAETTADRNSYGFRECRSCADAVAAAFGALAKPNSAPWVLEGDISGCFDNISHDWMIQHLPVEKLLLRQWLKSGYKENGCLYPTDKGTPQGGVISPLFANMTLDGMEQAVLSAVPRRNRVNFIRYADDFLVTGKSKAVLEKLVRPAIERFLALRGLQLSAEKTVITHITNGFTFLGQTFRKHGNVLHITPSAEGVRAVVEKVGTLIRRYRSAPIEALIKKLNQILRGWANYHRHVVASRAFSRVDTYVYAQLWRMVRRRHSQKSRGWLIRRYWTAAGRKWLFAVKVPQASGNRVYQVLRVCSIGIRRHVKIRAAAHPYAPEFSEYLRDRRRARGAPAFGV